MKKKQLSLRVSIFATYVTTFLVLIVTIIICEWLIYFKESSIISKNMMDDAASAVLNQLSLQIQPAVTSAKLTQLLFQNDFINEQKMADYSYYLAKNLPNPQLPNAARIAAWGDSKGNNIETSLEVDGTYSTSIILRNTNLVQDTRLYRDLNGKVIKRESKPTNYDPRIRPWYVAAKEAKKMVWSDFFLSYPYKNPSTSVSFPLYKQGVLQGVFEIEVKLVGISDFLSTLKIGKNGVVFIINGKNELIAFPGMKRFMGEEGATKKFSALVDSGKPWLGEAFAYFNKNHTSHFTYTYEGKNYLASFDEIPEFKAYGWKVGIVIPEKSFIQQLKNMNYLLTEICLIALLLGVIIASFFSKHISKPIKLLIDETKKIKNFHLEDEILHHSIIKEVDELEIAINSMKINLRSFQKYLPAELVRQLIMTGQDIKSGGTKKMLTTFFTDIKNFTTISENMDPEQLMPHLGEYLNELSTIIIEEKGTIDKYIGDSIMAFWNAPISDEEHCFHGCRAALRCKKRLEQLNAAWGKKGENVFITRIGVHTGEAIVGNIGSLERMNYTALGDSINIASRLEEVNTIYGTTIMVSEEVVKRLDGRFVFRFLDQIAVRGRVGSYKIYELMEESLENLTFNLDQYKEFFAKGFNAYQQQNWTEAIRYFEQCLVIYLEDSVAPVFIQRCNTLKLNTPIDWDGIWRG